MTDTRTQPPPVPAAGTAALPGNNGPAPSGALPPAPSRASALAQSEPPYDYELVVIGGGPAGEKGAAQAAYFGHKAVVIEKYKELGGACINWGTIASKT